MFVRVNTFLIEKGSFSLADKEIGIVVENSCNYFRSISYPSLVEGGLNVTKIGKSSVAYEIGIFEKEFPTIAAYGTFVHVYVDRTSMKPLPIPEKIRKALHEILLKTH